MNQTRRTIRRPTSIPIAQSLNLDTPSSGTTTSNLLTPNIESYYFSLRSPEDIELSDPDGCSLIVPKKCQAALSSPTASPANSVAADLNLFSGDIEDDAYPLPLWYLQQNLPKSPRMQECLIREQQILLKRQLEQLQRLLDQSQASKQQTSPGAGKNLASMESDGLSSGSSSGEDLFLPLRKFPSNLKKSFEESFSDVGETSPLLNSSKGQKKGKKVAIVG